jgi:hypothetical protein
MTFDNAQIKCTSITSEKLAGLKFHYLIAVVERTSEPKHKTEIVFEEGKDIPIPDGYELKTVKYLCEKPLTIGGTITADHIKIY